MHKLDVESSFKRINRADFVSDESNVLAFFDVALPIGFGQTISQPSTVRDMLDWLDVEEHQRILDVGSGSGWTTALLADLVGSDGFVYGVERIPELLRCGRENCSKYDIDNVSFHLAGKTLGLPEYAPFDRILVSASSSRIPTELIHQLTVGGKMVVPVRRAILEVTHISDKDLDISSHEGYSFVPLISST